MSLKKYDCLEWGISGIGIEEVSTGFLNLRLLPQGTRLVAADLFQVVSPRAGHVPERPLLFLCGPVDELPVVEIGFDKGLEPPVERSRGRLIHGCSATASVAGMNWREAV